MGESGGECGVKRTWLVRLFVCQREFTGGVG